MAHRPSGSITPYEGWSRCHCAYGPIRPGRERTYRRRCAVESEGNPPFPGDKWRGNFDPAVAAILQAQPDIGPLLPLPDDQAHVDIRVQTVRIRA